MMLTSSEKNTLKMCLSLFSALINTYNHTPLCPALLSAASLQFISLFHHFSK